MLKLPSRKPKLRSVVVTCLTVALICLSACGHVTKGRNYTGTNDPWCTSYQSQECAAGDQKCIKNEAEYMCRCERGKFPDLEKLVCEA